MPPQSDHAAWATIGSRPRTERIAGVATVQHPEYPNLIWVLVETDGGAVGLGETFFNADAVAGYVHEIVAPYLLRTDPDAINAIWHGLSRQWGRSGMGTESRAASAIDVALWDLWGRRTGLPIYQLLGGKVRDRIQVYNTCGGSRYGRDRPLPGNLMSGLETSGPYEDLAGFMERPGELARELLEAGITGMKMWPLDVIADGTRGLSLTQSQLDDGLAPLVAIRDAVGSQMDIALELHGRWSVPAAKRIISEVEDLRLMWVEDPIRMGNPGLLAEVARGSRTPIVAGETLGGCFTFRDYLQAGAVDIVMADPLWVGGITESRRVAELAAAYARPFTPHDCTGPVGLSVGVHICLHCDNAFIQEFVRAYYFGWYRDIADGLPPLHDGHLLPSGTPGHGIDLKEDFLADSKVLWAR